MIAKIDTDLIKSYIKNDGSEDVVYNGEDTDGNTVTDAPVKLLYIDGELVWHEHTYGSWVTVTDATCTTAGSKRRSCTITDCSVSDTQTIAALGHSYSILKVDPTCTEQGYTLHECTRSGCHYSYKDSYMDALGHSWNNPSYSWSGYTSCTATRTCANESSHKQTSSATISSSITTPATCTTAGVKTYYATFDPSVDWASKRTKTQTIAALGHSYSPAGSTWNGTTECIATGLCVHDQTHTTTQKGTITSEVTTPATCTTKGTTTYTATFSKLLGWTKAPATATKQVQNIAATGHSYGSATYSWNGYTSCTATRTCANDSSHKETATATITSSVTKAATCTEAGTRTYAASFSASWASKQTKTETIAATGHKSSDWIIDSEATTLGAGSKHKECTVCGAVLETVTIPKLEPLTYTLLSGGTYSVKATDVHVSGAITIPSTYNSKAVTRIEDNAFKGCTNIQSVAMPNSITYIGNRAFNTCTLMNTITMSNSVTYIGSRAFAGCFSLVTGVTIPASVTTIGAYAFEGCNKLLKVTFEHRKWNAGSTSVTVTAFNGATLLKTTYVSVAWTKVSRPTLVAPVYDYAALSQEMIDVAVINNNSVAVTCYFSVYDNSGAEVYSGSITIGANAGGWFSAQTNSSHISPFEILAHFEADGYNDSEEIVTYVE